MSQFASITFDMDDLIDIVDGYGADDSIGPFIYERAVPRMLELLDEVNLKATFFVISKAVTGKYSKRMAKKIAESGHEIANHSYSHPLFFDLSYRETQKQIVVSTKILSDIAEKQITGYRAPGLTLNKYVMEILVEQGYLYDSSINPTFFFIGEFLYMFAINPGKRNLPRLFYLKHGLSKSYPYKIIPPSFFKSRREGKMLELPISHVPYFNLPYYATFHFMFPFTYKLFEKFYFMNKNIVYHAHGLDFLDPKADNIPSAFNKHPGISKPWPEKRQYFLDIFSKIKNNCDEVVTTDVMSKRLKQI